jgi:hypothetical protein
MISPPTRIKHGTDTGRSDELWQDICLSRRVRPLHVDPDAVVPGARADSIEWFLKRKEPNLTPCAYVRCRVV